MTDWMDDVPCRERPGLFFSYSVEAQKTAAGICRNECPSLVECAAWARKHGDLTGDGRAVHGVIAGVIPPTLRPQKGLRRCELASCGALFDGYALRRYCTEDCSQAARAAAKRDHRGEAAAGVVNTNRSRIPHSYTHVIPQGVCGRIRAEKCPDDCGNNRRGLEQKPNEEAPPVNHPTSFSARPTTYKGVRMRSRLEAGFAAWLDGEHVSWEYEPECFADELGQYLPDFRLTGVHVEDCTYAVSPSIYVEVKPADPALDIIAVCRRMEAIWASEPGALLAVAGPHDLSFWSFPITVRGKWGVGVWTRCVGGCGQLSVSIAGAKDLISPLCPVCWAAGGSLESPWAGQPYWMR